MTHHYYLDPFGCVKNQVDAETMMAVLNQSNWAPADDPAAADLIIINSCGFIESAKQESINAVLGYRKQYPGKKILLAGCLAQRYAKELAESLPEADAFFGNSDLTAIAKTANSISGISTTDDTSPAAASSLPGNRPLLSLPGQAYVKISEGCNNRCSFCAIPNIRGPLRSHPIPQVLDECRLLLDRGIRELCLIGQDLGSYGADLAAANTVRSDAVSETNCRENSLPDLLEAIATLPGHFWVRFLYIHPDNFPRPILEICRRDKRFLPYFDLPFQHGSAKILRAMNRRLDAAAYLSLINDIRRTLPDAVIRSTFLTGFPGETEEDFRKLLDFQARAELDWLGVFTYSREEDTPAYDMKPRVSKRTAAQRKTLIEEQQTAITEGRMDRFIGQTLEVLVEETVDEEEGLYLGRLYCQAPEVDGSAVIRSDRPLLPGAFIQGRVFGRAGFDLEVTPV
ncbi:ribosomal protein S12 methylthiotransferase RimO [Spirochaetia bacterium]|nr:ribosomal protein S12 methylthiotransferase RimO [Spirochaetia bacterium]